jgi:hypothetical protein
MTAIQRRCMIEATIAPLDLYRRGFARSKAGPFFPRPTVAVLLRSGALRRSRKNRRTNTAIQVTALAE